MGIHRLQVGTIQCMVVHEGQAEQPLSGVQQRYTNATDEQIQDALQKIGHEGDTFIGSINALYIESNGTRILVDTGFGPSRPAPFGQIIPNLESAGITLDMIDIVYLSHFHGDHIMGLMHEGQPTFPNARYITHQAEWQEWMSDEALAAMPEDRQAYFTGLLSPLADKFSFVDEGATVAEGVTVINVHGHTLGHSGLLLESNGEKLVHLVDMLHHEAQFVYPQWHFVYDSDGDLAEQSRRDWLKRCADENLLTLFYHLPFPGLGYVSSTDEGYRWQPVEV